MIYDSKPHTFRLPMSVSDRAEKLAKDYGVSVAEVLRTAVICGLPETEKMIVEKQRWIDGKMQLVDERRQKE